MKKTAFLFILFIFLSLTIISCSDKKKTTEPDEIEFDPITNAPSNLTFFNPEVDILELSWQDNSEMETRYEIKRSEGYGETTWETLAVLPENSTSYTDTQLQLGEDLLYGVFAYYGETQVSDYSYNRFHVGVNRPNSFKVSKINDNELKLTWIANQGWTDGYKIQRNLNYIYSPEDWIDIATIPLEQTEYIDSNLDLSLLHAYRVCGYKEETLSYFSSFGYQQTEMILVEGGTFTMGDTWNLGAQEINPAHDVTLSSFYIGKYEMTEVEWQLIYSGLSEIYHLPPELVIRPFDYISIIQFCNEKSERDNLPQYYNIQNVDGDMIITLNLESNGFRLPTEAEWEFAARGGNESHNYLYSGSDSYDEVGVEEYAGIGTKLPNELGIYDMTGNFAEKCYDIYSSYTTDSVTNPIGPDEGSYRVLRGFHGANVAERDSIPDYLRYTERSFRMVRNAQ